MSTQLHTMRSVPSEGRPPPRRWRALLVCIWGLPILHCATAPSAPSAVTAVPAVTAPAGLVVDALDVRFEAESPTLTEHSEGLHVRAPGFVATAEVHCGAGLGGAWSVGFVQAVRALDLRLSYANGASARWVLPFVPVSDSDGHFPWYSAEARRMSCAGRETLRLDDALETQVSWTAPVKHESREVDSKLTDYRREQSFRVWLIAIHQPSGRRLVLRAFDWRVGLHVQVTADAPLGARAKVIQRTTPHPNPLDAATASLPARVLVAPRANDLQELWWTDAGGVRTLLRPHAWAPR